MILRAQQWIAQAFSSGHWPFVPHLTSQAATAHVGEPLYRIDYCFVRDISVQGAAVATEDTRWRRAALHSLIRELDRQHAALATRLSRERRDCPVTHVARNQVVMIKRHVRAVMRAHELAMHDGGDATVYGAPLPKQAARAECWTECAKMDEDAMTALRGLAYDASPFSSGGAAAALQLNFN